jgi:hypothetical protein
VSKRWHAEAGWALLVVVASLGGAGCAIDDKPVPVSGKVTVNGKPAAGVGVVFHPKDGNGRPATAETSEDGTFQLTTMNPRDGALRGEYRVTLVWEEPVHPYLQYRDGAPQKEAARKDYERWKLTHKPRASPIPAEYADAASTPLEQRVPAPGGVANLEIRTGK